ncbi:MAG: hypothetical protein HYR66_07100 [Sphingobacteriales bacterium]|nr:hypothetical protein [Sphingobacteriales bacterium]MBI3718143.1 hypothetical protein [Sphingobacteriales bacterium]
MDAAITEMINKDFELMLPASVSEEELTNQLAAYINSLINNNFQQLIRHLYRIDINESKLKILLKENPGEDAGKIIAKMIIDRQLQKIKTRSSFPSANDIPDDEKW